MTETSIKAELGRPESRSSILPDRNDNEISQECGSDSAEQDRWDILLSIGFPNRHLYRCFDHALTWSVTVGGQSKVVQLFLSLLIVFLRPFLSFGTRVICCAQAQYHYQEGHRPIERVAVA